MGVWSRPLPDVIALRRFVYASRQLLENGIVTPKASEASALKPPDSSAGRSSDVTLNSARRHGTPVSRRVGTGTVRQLPAWGQCPAPAALRSTVLESDSGPVGNLSISMESLILAQDERWRRA